jgi:hypothetical protein
MKLDDALSGKNNLYSSILYTLHTQSHNEARIINASSATDAENIGIARLSSMLTNVVST